MPNYWSRFTHFHSIRSPARRPRLPPFPPRRAFFRADLSPADLSPTSPPLRPRSPSRRTRGSHRNLHFHFLPPPACRSITHQKCISIFCHRAPIDLTAASTAPTSPPITRRPRRRSALSVSQDSQAHRNLHFHFLPRVVPADLTAAAPRSPSRRLTETCISIFCHRSSYRPRRPLADLAAAPSRVFYLSDPLEFRFHFLTSARLPPFPPPPLRDLRLAGLAGSQKLAFPFFATARAALFIGTPRDFSPHRSNSKTTSLQKAIVSDCASLYHIFAHLSTIVENLTVFSSKFLQNVPNRAIFSHFFHFFIKFSQNIVIYSRCPLLFLRPNNTSPTLSTPRSAPLSPLSAPICPQIHAVPPHPHRALPSASPKFHLFSKFLLHYSPLCAIIFMNLTICSKFVRFLSTFEEKISKNHKFSSFFKVHKLLCYREIFLLFYINTISPGGKLHVGF